MANLEREGNDLVLRLSTIEAVESLHGDLRVPMASVSAIDVVDDAQEWTRIRTGFKVGMRLPGVASVATVYKQGRKLFVAVHEATVRGLRVTFSDQSWDEWVVGCEEPEAVRDALLETT